MLHQLTTEGEALHVPNKSSQADPNSVAFLRMKYGTVSTTHLERLRRLTQLNPTSNINQVEHKSEASYNTFYEESRSNPTVREKSPPPSQYPGLPKFKLETRPHGSNYDADTRTFSSTSACGILIGPTPVHQLRERTDQKKPTSQARHIEHSPSSTPSHDLPCICI